MRTIHNRLLVLFLALLLTGCTSPAASPKPIRVEIAVDGQTLTVELENSGTVDQALEQAHISLGALDRCEPDLFTTLSVDASVRVIRVKETFEIAQEIIPFQSQVLHNESLPNDQEVLVQAGKNGLREITYRQVIEDGVVVASQPIPVKSVVITEPQPEIRMVGIQSPFTPLDISGQIYYLRDGNVWLIEENTSIRKAIVATGDLDGRIFSISADRNWLIFTRRSAQPEDINSLWAVDLQKARLGNPADLKLIDLKVPNVIHFADWRPGSETRILFSTVEPRPSAPGWQANNDLHTLVFSSSGWTTKWGTYVEANSGGVYGWWGTDFSWSPDGSQLAYARPDGIGLVDLDEGVFNSLLDITPLQTHSDWAWAPGLAWNQAGDRLFTVDHPAPASSKTPEASPLFDLVSVSLDGAQKKVLINQSGMFAYPLVSPVTKDGVSQIAYLQALFPNQSETSRYSLALVDENGQGQRTLFPQEESAGLEPNRRWGVWSPKPLPESQSLALAILYQGNLWIIEVDSGKAFQITGDGLTHRVIWK